MGPDMEARLVSSYAVALLALRHPAAYARNGLKRQSEIMERS